MNLNLTLKKGFSDLKFGLTTQAVETLLGKPDLSFDDEEFNIIWLYNELKLRLTFYADEDFKLGYIICSHLDLTVFDTQIINQSVSLILDLFKSKGIHTWEKEQFDTVFNYFNEDNWVVLITEFDVVNKVEIGVVQKNLDEFDW